MTYSQTCPRCGEELVDPDAGALADAVVAHAKDQHRHDLDREIVLAHLDGRHPFDDPE